MSLSECLALWVAVGTIVTFLYMLTAETRVVKVWSSGPFGRARVLLAFFLAVLGFWVVILYWKFIDK